MKCPEAEALTVDYLMGSLPPPAAVQLKAHLKDCPACRETFQNAAEAWRRLGSLPEAKPSEALRERVDAIIEAYRQGMAEAPHRPLESARARWADWLAGWRTRPLAFHLALAAAAFAAGILTPPFWSRAGNPAEALDDLRGEVGHLRQMVTLTLLRQPSASERLEGVSYSYSVSPEDEKVLAALLQALDSDPNVNVRVAAVDALRQYAARTPVRAGLLRSLAKESSPLVQIELIDLLLQQREKGCIPLLEQIEKNAGLDPAVRAQAKKALLQFG